MSSSLTKILLVILTITYHIENISNVQSFKTAIQIEQRNGVIIQTSNRCRVEYNPDELPHSKDWLMNYYSHYRRTQNDSHRLRPCSKLTQFTTLSTRITSRYMKYIYHVNYSMLNLSLGNMEILLAIAKVLILVVLKIITKYYLRGYLQSFTKQNKALNELIDLLSKAFTIAIAKGAIKWALYPALRTALKTLLIAGLKTLLKPFTKRLKNKNKDDLSYSALDKINKWIINIQIKTIIKTIALHLLWLVFEKNHVGQSLHDIMFRVMVIITVKMAAKRLCKMIKKKLQQPKADNNKLSPNELKSNPALLDQEVLLFAMQKMVTKLVKLPLIKILF